MADSVQRNNAHRLRLSWCERCFSNHCLSTHFCCCGAAKLNEQLLAIDMLKGSLVFVAFLMYIMLSSLSNIASS